VKLTFSSPLISTLICNLMAPDTLDLSDLFSKLYQTSISPDNVLTSIMVWPRKSSDSRVNFCRSFDFKSLSSSHTRTLIRSDELWHSLNTNFHVENFEIFFLLKWIYEQRWVKSAHGFDSFCLIENFQAEKTAQRKENMRLLKKTL